MAREIEAEMGAAPSGELTYAGYLQLDRLLSCQQTLSPGPHHDELLFVIIHQTTELWFKLALHELRAALAAVEADDLATAFKILARVKHIQRCLFDQWGVLETLTPSEYVQFRGVLGRSSGFQSVQYRTLEFLLGHKDPAMLRYFASDDEASATLQAALDRPSIYQAFLAWLARHRHPVPADVLARDPAVPWVKHDGVVEVFRRIYADPQAHWEAYNMCEKLVDLEENVSLWRYRHVMVVQRVIGFKRGTGGSSGVSFLKKMIDVQLYPELWAVRTEL
ncbi:MAG: tryptophan 2,3-dioxygenase [Alphaproteobacteria bacterium]|nr:tryptophan 2,3-dioxygenase [Alphaproteobacteria bacterium]